MNRLKERKAELKKLHEEGLIQFDQYNLLFDQIEKTEESFIQEKRMVLTDKKRNNERKSG